MDDNIGNPDWVDFVGPFTGYRVVVNGYAVPRLTAAFGRETVALIVDHRFSADFPRELAQQAAWLIANAQAIAEGYSCHGENSQPFNPHKVQVMEIGHVETRRDDPPDDEGPNDGDGDVLVP